MLFTTPGAADSISGVILFDETIRQNAADGRSLVSILEGQGVIPGIKVDKGTVPLHNAPGELVTEGLDGLGARLAEYRQLGARFAKWRAVIDISDTIPSQYCLDVNAHALARYAALCQQEDIVPIVEPEVLMDGSHSIETCFDVTRRALHALFSACFDQKVDLPGALLKPNMVIPGKLHSGGRATPDAIAEATIACFREVVPAAIPGIVFLSGGQSDEEATANLDAINKRGPHPWSFSFSYGRALQAPALKAWLGSDDNIAAGQAAYAKRARLNGHAANGTYDAAMEAAS
jgi:fructose-bisphosphate aldolase class I